MAGLVIHCECLCLYLISAVRGDPLKFSCTLYLYVLEIFLQEPEKCNFSSIAVDSDDESDLMYSVKFINPKKKSMYFVKKWCINKRFQSVKVIQKHLKETFEKRHVFTNSGGRC